MTIARALLPVWGLLLNAAVQVACARSGLPLLRAIAAGFAAGAALVLWFSGPIACLTGDMPAYAGFGYCYFHFLNLGETARRIRLVRELYESPAGLSEAELLERYCGRDILRARIERLVNNGQLSFRSGRYFTGKPALLSIARVIAFLKYAVIGKKFG